MNAHRMVAIVCLALLAPCGVPAGVDEGRARITPWSGYWWKLRDAKLQEPLHKYDLLTGRQAAPYEAAHKEKATAPSWAGYCHAWTAAAILEREPTASATARGPNGRTALLSVGDQKGWLTVCHDGDQVTMHGLRYGGKPGEDVQDIYPDRLWMLLRSYVKVRGVPLALDIDATEQVWNYPAYRYRVEYRPQGSDGLQQARMEVWMADDKVAPDFVGTRVKKKTYQFTFRMQGGRLAVGSGRWTGPSLKDHPDFAWYPTLAKATNSEINPVQVHQMIKLSTRLALRRDLQITEADEVDAGRCVAVGSGELATLLVGARSASSLALSLTPSHTGPFAPGEAFSVRGRSGQGGHLYLFRTASDGEIRLLFPRPGQDGQVKAGDSFEIGGSARGGNTPLAAPRKLGTYRVVGLVSDKPLALGSLEPAEGSGEGSAFLWTPSEEQVARDLLLREVSGSPRAGLEESGFTEGLSLAVTSAQVALRVAAPAPLPVLK